MNEKDTIIATIKNSDPALTKDELGVLLELLYRVGKEDGMKEALKIFK